MRKLLFICMACLVFAGMSGTAFARIDIYISKANQHMTVKVNGKVKYAWPVSTGTGGYPTPSGSYKPRKLVRHYYSTNWKSDMPYSIFFSGDKAIHATGATGRLGQAASHGCVRLAPGHAAALFALVKTAPRKTWIHIR